ncbi:MAG: hypothetical protein MZV64_00440 [Ignavibacteriales bacterium]|nr:hypothetical protein [Ignavibacteriales bacterium]
MSKRMMRINPPVDPLFRVGRDRPRLRQGPRHGRAVFAKELLTEEEDLENAAQSSAFGLRVHRCDNWRAGAWTVVSRGRPVCPQCGQPDGTRRSLLPEEERAFALAHCVERQTSKVNRRRSTFNV